MERLDAQAIREVCDRDEQKLLELIGRGKSPVTIAKLYRQYEGENGVEEALAKIREKVLARMEGRDQPAAGAHLLDEKPLEEQLQQFAGDVDVHQAAAEAEGRLNGAGGAAAPPTVAPPAPAPRSNPTPRTSPPASGSPAPATANGGHRVPTNAEIARERDDKVLQHLKDHGPKRQSHIQRECGIPSGSIMGVMQRLERRGEITREKSGGQVVFSARGGGRQQAATAPGDAQEPLAGRPCPSAAVRGAQGRSGRSCGRRSGVASGPGPGGPQRGDQEPARAPSGLRGVRGRARPRRRVCA